MNTLKFVVPGKPRVQQRPIVLRRGWAIDPPESKAEKKRIAQIAYVEQQRVRLPILAGDLEVGMSFYGLRPNADISNAIKLVEDALNKVIYLDDKQICKLIAERFTRFPGEPRTEVEILERLPEQPALL